jgi:uncharacterized alpha/beta hydrolase family protein
MVSIFCGIYLKIHGSGGQKRSAEVMIPFLMKKLTGGVLVER